MLFTRLNSSVRSCGYGSFAPGAPRVFVTDEDFSRLWAQPERWYLLTFQSDLPRYKTLVGAAHLRTVAASGGKVLLTNHPEDEAIPPGSPASE